MLGVGAGNGSIWLLVGRVKGPGWPWSHWRSRGLRAKGLVWAGVGCWWAAGLSWIKFQRQGKGGGVRPAANVTDRCRPAPGSHQGPSPARPTSGKEGAGGHEMF
jgi:hypothetical protein